MADLRAIKDQEPWRLVDEDRERSNQYPHPLFRVNPGMTMIGAEEEKESNVT